MTWTGKRPPLRSSDWEVRPVDIAIADRIIRRFHYSGSVSKALVAAHGLFPVGALWDEECRGVAWWLPPIRAAATAVGQGNPDGVLTLSRLVVEPGMPGNAASFLMARSRRLLDRARWTTLLTYADEWRGHSGAIYLADGWAFDGKTEAKEVWTLNGRLLSMKVGPKTRTRADMIALGAVSQGKHCRKRFVRR